MVLNDFAYNSVNTVQDTRATRGSGLQSNSDSLCGYMGMRMVNTRYEQVNIVVMRVKSSWESVPQNIGSWEEVSPLELTSHTWDLKGIRVVNKNVCSMVDLNREC